MATGGTARGSQKFLPGRATLITVTITAVGAIIAAVAIIATAKMRFHCDNDTKCDRNQDYDHNTNCGNSINCDAVVAKLSHYDNK